jgi:aminoglycoside 2'-N-acetyltransferase I
VGFPKVSLRRASANTKRMMRRSLRIERLSTDSLSPAIARAVGDLCDAAYAESVASYFQAIGPGEHLLGWRDDTLVSHLMWVPRWLRAGDGPLLRTAYVELVATAPAHQRQGYAGSLLEYFPSQVGDFELAALSPATESLYSRAGWQFWWGPLAVRTDAGLVPTPDEEVMVLQLPGTPPLDRKLPLSVEWRAGEVW